MTEIKLLLLEDDDQDIETCCDMKDLYNDENEHGCHINIVVCRDTKDAEKNLDASFDGAIIDLKIDKDDLAGNTISTEINSCLLRIPIVVFTGTPDNVDNNLHYFQVYEKGAAEYKDIFDSFVNLYNTGLTRIMGGRGAIETQLNTIFTRNVLPQINEWINHAKKDAKNTEKALIRHIFNYLLSSLKDGDIKFLPEEVYLKDSDVSGISTGALVKKEDKFFIVLTPSCDLVVRPKTGKMNTNRILVVEVEPMFERRNTFYYHYLPAVSFFPGGNINFRNIVSLEKEEFDNTYEMLDIVVAPLFIKDIVSRFSSYYARQGQPEIEF